MKKILLLLAFVPGFAVGQALPLPSNNQVGDLLRLPMQPVAPIAVVAGGPVMPVPPQAFRSEWGYSVVTKTTTEPNPYKSQLYGRDVTDSTTTTTVVPNNFMGQPNIFHSPWD